MEGQGRQIRSVEFKFPFILIRSGKFLSLYEKLGRLRITRVVGWFMVFAMPIITAAGTVLLVGSIIALLTRPEVQEVQRAAGPQVILLIPGVNPYLPIIYGWIGIVTAIIIHEAAHGILARSMGYTVKSSGILLFLGIPMGAFVELDEKEVKVGRGREVYKMLAAGPVSNAIIAAICLGGLLVVINGITPIASIGIVEVLPGSPAEGAGLRSGDMIMTINGKKVLTFDDLREVLHGKDVGDVLDLEIARGEGLRERLSLRVELADLGEGRPMMGVRIGSIPTVEYLESYKAIAIRNPLIHLVPPSIRLPNVIPPPYSERVSWLFTHTVLGENFHIVANLLYWIWFVNINVAIFNALPIYPLDGGQILRKLVSSTVGRRVGERIVLYITTLVSVVFILLIASLVLIPYIGLVA